MKKCLLFGNCQIRLLRRYLLKTNFTKYYEIIPTIPVQIKDAKNLDHETLSSVDLIIYQNVSDTFGHDFSSAAILSHLKPSCEKILFPSMFFNVYWPQYCKQVVVRPVKKLSISPAGLFPYGDSNIIRLMQSGVSLENIITQLSDEDFYSESEVFNSLNNAFASLKKREQEQHVDITVSKYIYENYQNNYLMETVNHPTCFVGIHVVTQILKLLNIEHSGFDLKKEFILDSQTAGYDSPIYPSVIRRLGLSFIDKHHRYRFHYNNRLSFERYIDFYYKHAIGMEFVEEENEDPVSSDSLHRYLDCPATTKYMTSRQEAVRQSLKSINSTVHTMNQTVEHNIHTNFAELQNIALQIEKNTSPKAPPSRQEDKKKTEPVWCDNVIIFKNHAFLPTLKNLKRVHSQDFVAVISLLARDSPSPAVKEKGRAVAEHCSKLLAASYLLTNSGGIWKSRLGFFDKLKGFLILLLRRKDLQKI